MSGIFTGVGVGPGDSELMTLKAVRKIRECSVIAVPVSDNGLDKPVFQTASQESVFYEGNRTDSEKPGLTGYLEQCVAYRIAAGAVPEISEKDRIFLPMPMIKDKDRLRIIHDCDALAVEKLLEENKDVVFLTLGDPTVYSTCMYIHRRLKQAGYRTAIVPGITSFCAAAARLDMSLAENSQELHILPASYDIGESLNLPGTKVLMKAGRKMNKVKQLLTEAGMDAKMVENCGMENEKVYADAGQIPEQAGYYSLLVVKEGRDMGGDEG